ncbi:hypothetical protein [Sphingomonas sp. M1-B02]|uniref:hypothetical protein n=1 Tax=Sphingomonas sp. M1-B02 TaxID=3114300 RepID=UPI00223F64D2|nr:hypothetical protein [Sphingomonas sp. S6-11]UZK66437.1 hypothetical protein OKW87_00935 [Sphingomonas sp. S6-11]
MVNPASRFAGYSTPMAAVNPSRDERRFVWLVLFGGLVLRLVWLAKVNGPIDGFYGTTEATNLAIAIAQGRGIADPYFSGYGPTAHLLPISAAIAALPIWLFGIGSASAILLLGWSLLQTAAAYLLLHRLFQRLDSDARVTRWGLALLCLAPPFVPQEVLDFRFWEGAGALCLGAVNLLLILRYEEDGRFGWRRMLLAAALSAFTFFYCPPVGLAVDTCWAWFALRRLPFAQWTRFAALAAAALALLLVPWAARNAQMLGEPVLVRSNFGLEFALANHPAAVSGTAQEHIFANRLLEIHPYQKLGKGQQALRAAGGEVAYFRMLGAQTLRWVADHLADFVRLSLRHLREFFFPRAWQMYFSGWEGMRDARAWTISLVNLFGLIGLAIGLYRRRRGYMLLALYVATIALPYALFQPMPRYIYLVYGVLAFLAVEALVSGFRYISGKGPGWLR